ncbi:MAG: tRNA (adenosine(37)-N6)-threonylcarbamoyltransferase complex ATPase subunit type 1 TsaE [Oscillospiraceae bacterium]|nr:tRNA (adenosine(37)-N6)-threonylcarbamoyltransferase complex ATPase subunit type 1 TsaE [Oscillospiraceae bacterium]
MQYLTNSPEETEAVAAALAARLSPGTVLALRGDLGAGKTAFVRGLARGLGAQSRVTSPTFSIVQEYPEGRIPLFHFDLYRLQGADDLFDIGWEDYLARGGICAVEWSERLAERMEPDFIVVAICRGADDTQRIIQITGGVDADENTGD